MASQELWISGLILVGVIFIMVGVPCACIAVIGYGLLKKLSYYPSKTPAIQMGVLVKLLIVEIFAFTLIMVFYHVMTVYPS